MCYPRCSNAGYGRPGAAEATQINWLQASDHCDDAERRHGDRGSGDEGRGSRFHQKPFDDEKLLDAINEAMAMETVPVHDRESMEAARRIARLSPRERQVLDKLVAGRLTKQIAYDLGISARTVEVHRARMFARLGTRTPAEAVRLAVLAQLAPAHVGSPATDRPRSVVSRALPK